MGYGSQLEPATPPSTSGMYCSTPPLSTTVLFYCSAPPLKTTAEQAELIRTVQYCTPTRQIVGSWLTVMCERILGEHYLTGWPYPWP